MGWRSRHTEACDQRQPQPILVSAWGGHPAVAPADVIESPETARGDLYPLGPEQFAFELDVSAVASERPGRANHAVAGNRGIAAIAHERAHRARRARPRIVPARTGPTRLPCAWPCRPGRTRDRGHAPIHHPRTQTLGIIGWGRIGRAVSLKAMALGFKMLANDPYVDPKQMLDAGVTPADKETLMRESDYVSLHTPLTDETRLMIDRRLLALMRPSAYLINTARGPIIDEVALLEAVQNGRIAGAALDVLSSEPPSPDHPFLHDDRFFITPHSAWCSEESDAAVWEWAARNVAAVLRNERPPHAVNQIAAKGV